MGDQDEQAGAAVEAIRAAELSLARQSSAAAQVDLQVLTAILNAHTARADGAADLARFQSEVESAVATRTDLDTPAGARAFQHYLLSRLRDIRAVIEAAELDATSKATLSAALAALYATATPGEAPSPEDHRGERDNETPVAADSPVDLGFGTPMTDPPAAPSTALPTPMTGAPAASVPPWSSTPGGESALPGLGSLGSLGSLSSLSPMGGLGTLPDGPASRDRFGDKPDRPRDTDPASADPRETAQPDGDVGTAVDPELSDPELSDPEVAAVISAAVAGTPIAEAFAQQGITIPAPGTPVADPLDPAGVVAGDVGILADRHALALGNAKALLDNTIQPISGVGARGLLGWLHPVKPKSSAPVPVPAQPTA